MTSIHFHRSETDSLWAALRLSLLAPVLGLCLVLARPAAAAAPPANAVAVSSAPGGGGVDWIFQRAAKAFTSDNKIFGEVHLPVIAINPNTGLTYGVLPVWLFYNEHHDITQIIAPMFLYNRTFGAGFSGSYYYYPSSDEKLRALLEGSQRSNYRASLEYYDRAYFGGLGTLNVVTNIQADGGAQFYGVGPRSSDDDEASERLLEDLAKVELGVKFWDHFVATAGWEVRRTDVQAGPVSTPATLDPKLERTTEYSFPRVILSRDTRDLAFTPSQGSLLEVFTEYSNTALGSSEDYEHYGGQWRWYLPTTASLTTVFHAQSDWSNGGEVPFTALSELGGSDSLRAFADGRFQDRGSAFINIEERWTVHSIELVHTVTEFQIAPFFEAGTVFPSWSEAQSRYVEPVGGVAFRLVVKPSVVGKVEIGFGREGAEEFVGIDYPF